MLQPLTTETVLEALTALHARYGLAIDQLADIRQAEPKERDEARLLAGRVLAQAAGRGEKLSEGLSES